MLTLVMFLNGLAVMVLEMVGARLLAPWMGTSVVVWTSLIGVILASLSLGYWLGGRLADRLLHASGDGNAAKKARKDAGDAGARREHARAVLAGLLMGASACVLVTALVQSVVLELLSRAVPSLHLAAVCAAVLLFAAPSVLCGMVSPYAMRLAITHSDGSGSVIGRLNAVSTVGSIVGTFLGGFVLISWFGSTEITLGVAACLLGAACAARDRPFFPRALLAALLLLAAFGSRAYSSYLAEQGTVTLETPYSSIQIMEGSLEGRPIRLLRTDPGSFQSGAYRDAPNELAFAYTRFYRLGTLLNPRAKRILMLGGGGYSVPKWLLAGQSGLASRDFSLDVVELDPGMTKAAQSRFWLPRDDPRMRILHEDARGFLNRSAKNGEAGTYQLIFADIFNSHYSVPFHVGTVETARKVRDLLSENGVFLMNIITAVEGDNGRLLRSIYRAFASEFGNVYLFPVQSPADGDMIQNVMLLALRSPRELPDPAAVDTGNIVENARIAAMLRSRWTRPLPDDADAVPALTDNYAPVERYTLGLAGR